jgi:hypothetical protein
MPVPPDDVRILPKCARTAARLRNVARERDRLARLYGRGLHDRGRSSPEVASARARRSLAILALSRAATSASTVSVVRLT